MKDDVPRSSLRAPPASKDSRDDRHRSAHGRDRRGRQYGNLRCHPCGFVQAAALCDADHLVVLDERWPNLPGPRPISKLNYRDWAEQNTVFERIAAVSWGSVTVNE